MELKAWQLARERVGQKIRKQVWDSMEVKGRSIKVISVKLNSKPCERERERLVLVLCRLSQTSKNAIANTVTLKQCVKLLPT